MRPKFSWVLNAIFLKVSVLNLKGKQLAWGNSGQSIERNNITGLLFSFLFLTKILILSLTSMIRMKFAHSPCSIIISFIHSVLRPGKIKWYASYFVNSFGIYRKCFVYYLLLSRLNKVQLIYVREIFFTTLFSCRVKMKVRGRSRLIELSHEDFLHSAIVSTGSE